MSPFKPGDRCIIIQPPQDALPPCSRGWKVKSIYLGKICTVVSPEIQKSRERTTGPIVPAHQVKLDCENKTRWCAVFCLQKLPDDDSQTKISWSDCLFKPNYLKVAP